MSWFFEYKKNKVKNGFDIEHNDSIQHIKILPGKDVLRYLLLTIIVQKKIIMHVIESMRFYQ